MSTNCKSSNASSGEDDPNELRRGPWTAEEDTLLIHYIARHGEGRWNLLAKRSGLRRTGKSCRLRWLNYLKPDVKRGNLTSEEQLLILDLHSKWGNRWSKIAQYLPGRTDNEIKNYWRTRVKKQAKHLKIDIKSTAFQDIVRRFWMPRLIQKMQGSTSSAMLVQNNPTAPMPIDSASKQSYSSAMAETSSSRQKVPSGQGNLNMSMNMRHISPFSEYSNIPFQPTVLSNDNNTTFVQGCSYGGDKNDYDIGAYDDHTTNVSSEGVLGNPVEDCHVAGSNWAENEFLASMWNMDEFWQFKG